MTSMDKRRNTIPHGGSRKQNVYVVLEVAERNYAKIHGVYSTSDKAEMVAEQLRDENEDAMSEFQVSKHRIG